MHRTFDPDGPQSGPIMMLTPSSFAEAMSVVWPYRSSSMWGTMLGFHPLRLALKFLLSQGSSMHNHNFPDEEIILDENVKFGLLDSSMPSARCRNMRPRNQGVAGLYVVARVIRFKFRDLGVNEIFVEVVKFDVSS